MENITIQMQGYKLKNGFCVYDVLDSQMNLIFKGVCRIENIGHCSELFNKKEFDPEQKITIISNVFFDTQKAAEDYLYHWQRQNGQPYFNKVFNHHKKFAIVCNETGQRFATQLQCAQAMGIHQAALCQHLRGRSGYKSIKGFTFRNQVVTTQEWQELKRG